MGRRVWIFLVGGLWAVLPVAGQEITLSVEQAVRQALARDPTVAAAVFFLYAKLVLQQSPQGFTALAVSIAFFAGVQLIFLGVIGEYIGRICEEVKPRPHHVIKQV